MEAKTCSKCRIEKLATAEFFYRGNDPCGFSYRCKECCMKYTRESYKKNRDERLAKKKRWYVQNSDEYNANQRKRRKENIEESREYYRMASQKRRAKEKCLSDDWTTGDDQFAREYWNHCCAICGRPKGLWHTIAMDHWIAISDPREDNPGNVPHNIIPMCHGFKDGKDGCNQSKRNKDPIEWLTQKFGKRKAKKKLVKIETYFDLVRR